MFEISKHQASPRANHIPHDVWRIASVVVFGAFMAALDTALINVGLNTIVRDLHGSLSSAQWVGSGYLIALSAALPACAWLGRRFGGTRLWLHALAAFTAFSVLCAASTSLPLLIFASFKGPPAAFLCRPGRQSSDARLGRDIWAPS